MPLSPAEKRVLRALVTGATLKSHRYLDGRKEYRLHPLSGEAARAVSWETVDHLREQALIDSNKKFPAATYLLTARGKALAEALLAEAGSDAAGESPLTATGWE